jgi:hypothetical protein
MLKEMLQDECVSDVRAVVDCTCDASGQAYPVVRLLSGGANVVRVEFVPGGGAMIAGTALCPAAVKACLAEVANEQSGPALRAGNG